MTDSDIILAGSGQIFWGRGEETGDEIVSEHDQICVFASGALLYSLEGKHAFVTPTPDIHVLIPNPTWSVLDMSLPNTANPVPTCERCGDDPSTMTPPVCPKCKRVGVVLPK